MAPHFQKRSLFCRFCFQKLFSKDFNLKKRIEDGVEHYYLFDWNKRSDLACRSLVYFLKNKPPVFFAELIKPFRTLECLKLGALAVVPGCSDGSKLNHAESLALSFMKQNTVSRVLTARSYEGLSRAQQKQKSRFERLKSNRLDVKEFRTERTWVFVDDVLVSGGTFKSISESMFTKPQAVFTLFYRPCLENKGFYDA